MNILITGGAGYIGSHITEELVNISKGKKNNIIIIDNLDTGYKCLINKQATFIKGDIRDKKLLNKIMLNHQIDTIFHIAANSNINEAENDKPKYRSNNIYGTKNLILATKNSTVKYFIFSSTCSIYGNVEGSVSEMKKPNPQNFYAYTKLKCEELIKKYSKEYGYRYGILRYFNVAGASDTGKIGEIEKSHGHLIKNIAVQSLNKKAVIDIFGCDYPTKDGTCVRDYIHVNDLSNIHIKGLNYLKNHNKSFVLNCGYGKGYSVLEIVDVFKKIKNNLTVRYQDRRKGDVAQVYSNSNKLKKLIQWRPKHNSINKIIESAIKWERKYKNIKESSF